ncbi:hypothetical protein ISCGN_030060 [Ixodes scapularis]
MVNRTGGRDSTRGMRSQANKLLLAFQIFASWIVQPASDNVTTSLAQQFLHNAVPITNCAEATGMPLTKRSAGLCPLAWPALLREVPSSSTLTEAACAAPSAVPLSGRDSTRGMRSQANKLLLAFQDSRLREAEAEVVYCLTRGAPKGPNLPRARLNHQDALFLRHGKATHSQTWAGEPAWLGVRGDATHQTPAFTGTDDSAPEGTRSSSEGGTFSSIISSTDCWLAVEYASSSWPGFRELVKAGVGKALPRPEERADDEGVRSSSLEEVVCDGPSLGTEGGARGTTPDAFGGDTSFGAMVSIASFKRGAAAPFRHCEPFGSNDKRGRGADLGGARGVGGAARSLGQTWVPTEVFGDTPPDSRLREAGAEVVYCLTRGAPKGPNLPRARLNHQDALFPGHGKATHSQTWAGEPAWLGVRGDATPNTCFHRCHSACPWCHRRPEVEIRNPSEVCPRRTLTHSRPLAQLEPKGAPPWRPVTSTAPPVSEIHQGQRDQVPDLTMTGTEE